MFGFSTVFGGYGHVIDDKIDSGVGEVIFRWWERKNKFSTDLSRQTKTDIKNHLKKRPFFFWFSFSFLLILWSFIISRLRSTACLERNLFCEGLVNFFFRWRFSENSEKSLPPPLRDSPHTPSPDQIRWNCSGVPRCPRFYFLVLNISRFLMSDFFYTVSVEKASQGTPEPDEQLIVSLDLLTGVFIWASAGYY